MDIKRKCKERGVTLTKLGEMCDMSLASVSQLINSGNPTYKNLEKIATALGITVSELVSDDEPHSNTLTCPKCGAMLKLVEDCQEA